MAIQISRREAWNNIMRFKKSLEEHNKAKEGAHGDRSYKVLVDPQTGDFRFPEKISSLEHRVSPSRKGEKAQPWREIQIHVSKEEGATKIHFELLDEKDAPLQAEGIQQIAWSVLTETVAVLNQIAREHPPRSPEVLPEEEALHDLPEFKLAAGIEDLAGWAGPINRIKAESLLRNKAPGTYLLRDGDVETARIASHLGEEVHAYICTILEADQKIADVLLLHTPRGWTFYRDNPDLSDEEYDYYSSPQMLLLQLKNVAHRPYHP